MQLPPPILDGSITAEGYKFLLAVRELWPSDGRKEKRGEGGESKA